MNALLIGCNQKSNRNPVISLTSGEIQETLDDLRRKDLVIFSTGHGQRVTRYKHNIDRYFSLDRRKLSLIAVLILRGAQTLGELRLHTHRMCDFTNLQEVKEHLSALTEGDEPLDGIKKRLPGQKEQRYIHLLQPIDDEPENSEIQNVIKSNEIEELYNSVDQLWEELNPLCAVDLHK